MNLAEYFKPAAGVVLFAALAGGWYWFENRSPPEEKDTPVQALVVVTKSTNACFSDLVRVTGFVGPRREAVSAPTRKAPRSPISSVREGDAVTENQELARLSAPLPQPGTPAGAGRPAGYLKAPAAAATEGQDHRRARRPRRRPGRCSASPSDELELDAEVPSVHLLKLIQARTAASAGTTSPTSSGASGWSRCRSTRNTESATSGSAGKSALN